MTSSRYKWNVLMFKVKSRVQQTWDLKVRNVLFRKRLGPKQKFRVRNVQVQKVLLWIVWVRNVLVQNVQMWKVRVRNILVKTVRGRNVLVRNVLFRKVRGWNTQVQKFLGRNVLGAKRPCPYVRGKKPWSKTSGGRMFGSETSRSKTSGCETSWVRNI